MKSHAPELSILVSRRPVQPQSNITPRSTSRSDKGQTGRKTKLNMDAPLSKSQSRVSSTSLDSQMTRRSLDHLSPVQEEYELLEYEWPDLPPLEQIREALARGRISKGVNYLLPVDKTKNSVEGVFRTDLRTMFKEPYLADGDGYSEEKIRRLSKFHYDTNTLPTVERPKTQHMNTRDIPINSESNAVRQLYTNSAPTNGIVGRNATTESLRQRSSLNFPIKQRLPPEAIKLKEEAERILRSVQEKDRDAEEEYDPTQHDKQILNEQAMGKFRKSPDKRRPIQSRRTLPSREMMRSLGSRGRTPPKTMAAKFRSYDDLKNSEVPAKREMPARLRSRYMSDHRNEAVWDWLNEKEKITDFSYFLEVCL